MSGVGTGLSSAAMFLCIKKLVICRCSLVQSMVFVLQVVIVLGVQNSLVRYWDLQCQFIKGVCEKTEMAGEGTG